MSTATHSFTVDAKPDKVWRVLSDLPLWRQFFVIPGARMRGWGEQFAVKGPPAVGTAIDFYVGDTLMQEWAIEEWRPQERLRIASRKCHDFFIKAMESSIDATISRLPDGGTQVEIEFSTEFTTPILRYPLNAFVPLRQGLKEVLALFEKLFRATVAATP